MSGGLEQAAYRLSPSLWVEDALGLQPDLWQKEVLDASDDRMLLCCSRQSGKSTTTAALALWTAIYKPKSLVLLLSPSLRQSVELFRNVAGFYSQVADLAAPQSATLLRLELENGSRIVSLPGKESTVRGFSKVALLIVDEAARVPDELYLAIRPMLAVSRGRLIALSTPWGRRGWFHNIWSTPSGWRTWTIVADLCPRISAEFLEEERQSMPKPWFEAEYYCKFNEPIDRIFGYDDILASIDDNIEPLVV